FPPSLNGGICKVEGFGQDPGVVPGVYFFYRFLVRNNQYVNINNSMFNERPGERMDEAHRMVVLACFIFACQLAGVSD
ncbi:MAG: hypothetical protein ABIS36_24165, partial [Chryseolinea sp.]